MQGSITLTPWELLGIAALPLSTLSKVLKDRIVARLGGREKTQSNDSA